MSRASLRLVPAVFLAGLLPACSSGGSTTPPAQHVTTAGKTTRATFTIQWTNPSAPTSVRRKDTISPSAQSVAVLINGTLNTIANRNGQSSQAIVLNAPVGTDTFAFNVYDGPNAQGHLLGSATVSQLIVDGAANSVTAVIQALCSVTNVQVAPGDPSIKVTSGQTGILASTVQAVVLAGQSPATLIIGPEDIDGNVIISGTAGTVEYAITGSATVTPIDGAHIQLTPTSGPRTTTPDTLTVAAPTCPSTTVAVQHSPAIYVEDTGYTGIIFDWYGDELGNSSLNTGDVLIGYDTVSKQMMAYNPSTGLVSAYALDLYSSTPKYTILTNSIATWSNYIHSVFAEVYLQSQTQYYTYTNGSNSFIGVTVPGETPTAVAASTFSGSPYVYGVSGPDLVELSLSTRFYVNSVTTPYTVVSIATSDRYNDLYAFNTSISDDVSVYNESLGGPANSTFGFAEAPVVGGADTDANNIYAVLANQTFAAATSTGTQLTGGDFGYGVGPGLAIQVISSNEQ